MNCRHPLILFCLISLCWLGNAVGASAERTSNILVLHSYHPGYNWTQRVNDGMQEVFAQSPQDLSFYVEYLDTMRHSDDYFQSHILKANLEYLLQQHEFDLVLASDNKALEYVRRFRQELFADLPIVFCGINEYRPDMLEGLAPITGVAENPDFESTLALVRRLHPDTREIVIVGRADNLSGQHTLNLLKKAIDKLDESWRYSFWNEMLPQELLPKISRLEKGQVILLSHQPLVREGEFLEGHQVVARLHEVSRVPIYSCWSHFFDPGIVGGRLIDGTDQGRWAAQLALRILAGEPVSSIPVREQDVARFMFDDRELKRFGILQNTLPPDSTLLYAPDTSYRLDKKIFWAGLFATVILLGLLIVLAFANARRRRAEKELGQSEEFYRGLFETLDSGLNSVDANGIIQRVNPAFCRMTGYAPHELLGQHVRFVTHPDDHDTATAMYQEVRQGKRRDFTYEKRFLRKDGSTFWGSVANVWKTDERGQPTRAISVVTDISKRKEAEQALSEERSFLQTVIDGVSDPIMVVGLNREVLLTNKAAQHSSRERHAASTNTLHCGQAAQEGLHRCDDPQECPIDEIRKTGEAKRMVHRYESEGQVRYLEVDASPLWDANGQVQGMIEASRDITDRLKIERQLRENEARLNHLAYHDTLTNLPNRLLFHDRLEQSLLQAQRHGYQLSVLFLDLDRFKNVNDSLGHAIGDQLLAWVARRLKGCIRESDTVARLGGDEFVFIIEEVADGVSARIVADKIRQALREPAQVEGHELFVSASIGISLFPNDAVTAEELVQTADSAMYRAKNSGGDGSAYYSPEMTSYTREQLFLEGHLRKAIDEKQFLLHYQPFIDLQSGHVVGIEALLRWQHPDEGMISPERFISLAEETGLIVPIGYWVLEQACREALQWQEPDKPPIRVAINMSARQFIQEDVVEAVAAALDKTGLPAACLEIEITESVLMVDVARATETMKQLTDLGVSLAIDDFGAGYSSLNYLKRFPIEKIKIDRSFVSDLIEDEDDAAIVQTIIALADIMKLNVVAEGIESSDQLQVLQRKGCGFGQGFLFSRPVPAEQVCALLQDCYIQETQLNLDVVYNTDRVERQTR